MSSTPNTSPSNAADQARLRKERREARIKAGGSARLDRITGLGGGLRRDPPAEPAAPSPASQVDDPEEVDISEHFYKPTSTLRPHPSAQDAFSNPNPPELNDEQLRAMMLGFPPAGGSANDRTLPRNSNPFASRFPEPNSSNPTESDDPMLKLMQQMMGGAFAEGRSNSMPNFPGMPGMGGLSQQDGSVATPDPYAYLWRIVHAIFALGLGLYIAFATTFSGTKLERERSALTHTQADGLGLDVGSIRFFYIFATFEVLLQTSRFFLEKGNVQPSGVLGMVMGLLPAPWKAYVALMLRYSRIWTTISSDAMVCVFVLGVCSWLRAS